MKSAFYVKPKLSAKAGRGVVLFAAVFVMTMAGAERRRDDAPSQSFGATSAQGGRGD